MAKKPICNMGSYIPTDEELAAYSWCINNKIFIAPKAKTIASWYAEIDIGGVKKLSPIAYPKVEIWKRLYEYYTYYYVKYRK